MHQGMYGVEIMFIMLDGAHCHEHGSPLLASRVCIERTRLLAAGCQDTDCPAVFVYERYLIEVKLGDFGLARLDSDETFTYVGTHDWIAPVSLVMLTIEHAVS
jgi:serine/threonine protein kinase